MYELPEDFDFSLLSGCYLDMVCFGIHLTKLDFSRPQAAFGIIPYRVSFCIEGQLKMRINNVWTERDSKVSATSSPLLDFLLEDVLTVEQSDECADALQLNFKNGDAIVISGEGDYECYSIYKDSGEIIVI